MQLKVFEYDAQELSRMESEINAFLYKVDVQEVKVVEKEGKLIVMVFYKERVRIRAV